MKNNSMGKTISIISLVVAVIGLSLGFAAYSTSLRILNEAQVTSGRNWNVGFSTDGSNIESVSTAGTVSGVDENNATNGSIDVTKYTINQTSGQIANLSTTAGSQVSYTLSILNKGTITAYGDSLSFSNTPVTCSSTTAQSTTLIEGESGAGTTTTGGNTTTISDADCAAMFGVSLSVAGTEYTSANAANFSNTIAANGNVPVILKIWYKGDAAAQTAAAKLDGDIVVTAGTITVIYNSNNS